MKKPYPRSYWVEHQKLLAGFYPGDIKQVTAKKNIRALLDLGIQCWINLQDENETNLFGNHFVPYNEHISNISQEMEVEAVYMKIPIVDQNITNVTTMKFILDTIDNAHRNDVAVYVHCWGGIGRTGTVIGCWLIRHGKANSENVFDVIAEMRNSQKDPEAYRDAPENEMQRQFVRNWKQGM